ncbi:hypothetical protein K461DRAFT_141876 [Myriangium duriaei CBS 260.36]|uniref:Uncharacterized protein n=1 Tax=Myriangium duriaei CBS 260.36 TaxID=1168546 RepID=A0A9P4J731_9PEZI|nr:hypothetical protein K461DRAFT_141876 [Myriangium duriaei CBS 260.36]
MSTFLVGQLDFFPQTTDFTNQDLEACEQGMSRPPAGTRPRGDSQASSHGDPLSPPASFQYSTAHSTALPLRRQPSASAGTTSTSPSLRSSPLRCQPSIPYEETPSSSSSTSSDHSQSNSLRRQPRTTSFTSPRHRPPPLLHQASLASLLRTNTPGSSSPPEGWGDLKIKYQGPLPAGYEGEYRLLANPSQVLTAWSSSTPPIPPPKDEPAGLQYARSRSGSLDTVREREKELQPAPLRIKGRDGERQPAMTPKYETRARSFSATPTKRDMESQSQPGSPPYRGHGPKTKPDSPLKNESRPLRGARSFTASAAAQCHREWHPGPLLIGGHDDGGEPIRRPRP